MARPLRPRSGARSLDPAIVRARLTAEAETEADILVRLPRPSLADNDEFGAQLEELRRVTDAENKYKARREALRDEITPHLKDPYAYIGMDGSGRYAYAQAQAITVVDLDTLRQMVPPDVFDEVTETKVKIDAFRRASAAKRISDEAVVACVRFQDKRPYVKFGVIPDAD